MNMVDVERFPAQCGMRTLVDLSEGDDLNYQILKLEEAFNDSSCGGSRGASQVIISDRRENEKSRWAETKANAYHGPTTENPNTRKRIKLYICTRATLNELKSLRRKHKKQT